MHTIILCLAVALLLPCASQCSPYSPHVPDQAVLTWFEGWYVRVVADDAESGSSLSTGPSSFGIITGYIPRGHAAWNNTLLEVFRQPRGGGRVQVEYLTDLQLNVSAGDGALVLNDPDAASPPNLTITSTGGQLEWKFAGEECSIAARVGITSYYVECEGPPNPWGPEGLGPEGMRQQQHCHAHALGQSALHWL